MQDVLWALIYCMGESHVGAAREIRRLTKTAGRSRVYLASVGAITPLISMLKSSSFKAKEAALSALLNLLVRNERNKVRIVKAGAVTPLVELLQSEDANLRETAAAAVLTLAVANANHKPIIGASGATPLIVEIPTSGRIQGKVDAVMACGLVQCVHSQRECHPTPCGWGRCSPNPFVKRLQEIIKSSREDHRFT